MDVPSVILSGGISFAGDDVEPVFILEAAPNVKRLSGRLDSINFLFPCCTCCKSRCTEVHFLFSWHNQTLSSHSIVFNSILIDYLNCICCILALFLVTLRSSSFSMNEGNPMTAQHVYLSSILTHVVTKEHIILIHETSTPTCGAMVLAGNARSNI